MIDIFALAVSHGLILLGLWRMIFRDDLNGDSPNEPDAIPAKAGTQSASPTTMPCSRFGGNDNEGRHPVA